MPEQFNYQEVTKILHELFKNAFIANCLLDEESVTQDELVTLEELDEQEVLENLKDLLADLLNFKKDHRKSDISELNTRSQQFEAMIQKLEAEAQHQLKIHLEETQSKCDQLEKLNEKFTKEIETLKVMEQTRVTSVTPTRNIEFKLQNLEEKHKDELNKIYEKHKQELLKSPEFSHKEQIRKRYEQKLQKLTEVAERRQKVMHRLEHDCLRLRTLLEEKTTDYDKMKAEYDKIYKKIFTTKDRRFEKSEKPDRPDSRNNELEMLRKKVDEKSNEVKEMQYSIKAKSIVKSPIPGRKYPKHETLRKSVGELDWIPKPEMLNKKDVSPSPMREDTLGVKKRRYTPSHYRSISDSVRPVSSRKYQQ